MSGSDDDRYYLPPAFLFHIVEFYSNDANITLCDEYIARQVFDGKHKWHIEWGGDGAGGLTAPGTPTENATPVLPSMFNNPTYYRNVKRFLIRALAYARIMGAVPVWYDKSPQSYVHEYVNARHVTDRTKMRLPYGILEPHECRIYGKQRHGRPQLDDLEYFVEPIEEGTVRGRGYALINLSMQPMIGAPTLIDHGIERIKAMFPSVMAKLGGKDASFSRDRTFIPRSIFYGIFEAHEELLETKNNLMDADWLASHPPVILATEVPKPLPIDMIDENTAYEKDSLFEANSAQIQRERRLTFAEAKRILDEHRRRRRGHGKKDQTIREMQREFYRRPDMMDDAEPLDPYISVAHAPAPTVINDYHFQRKMYFEVIHSAMGLGGDSFLSTAQWTAKKSGTAKGSALSTLPDGTEDTNSGDGLEFLLQGQMAIASQIYEQIHALTFGDYDFQHLSATSDAMDATLARLAASALKATNPVQEAKTLLQPEEGGEAAATVPAENEAAAQARLDEIESLKVTRKRLKSYMKLMHRGDIQSLASLVFVTSHDNKNDMMQRNDILLGLHGQGAIAAPELEKALQEVHGGGFKLREPPKEDKKPAVPKAKKKKPTKKEGERKKKTNKRKREEGDADADEAERKKKKEEEKPTKKRKREEGDDDTDETERTKKKQKSESESDSNDSDDSDDDSDSDSEEKEKEKKKKKKKKAKAKAAKK